MKKLILLFAFTVAASFAQCGSPWAATTGTIGATNLSTPLDGKPNMQCGSGAPGSSYNGTIGRDLYTNTSNGDIYKVATTGTPATWILFGAQGATGTTGSTGSNGANGAGYGGTSSTSITPSVATKVFTTQAGLAYAASGARIRAASTGSSAMVEGPATYSGTTLTIVADRSVGSGAHTDWVFTVAGEVGASGAGSGDMLAGTYDPANVAGQVLKDSGTNGLAVRTAAGITTKRAVAQSTGISVSNGDGVAGDPTIAMTAAQMTRTVCLTAGSKNASAVLADADLADSDAFQIPAASTVTEVTVRGDAGTPNILVGRDRAGTTLNFTSSALATAASGGLACSKTSAVAGIAGTTCSATLQNTSLNAGDWLVSVSGTAGGTAKQMSACVTFTVN